MKKLKHLKTFEDLNYTEDELYDEMTDLLILTSALYTEFSGEKYDFASKYSVEGAIEFLEEIPSEHDLHEQAQDIIDNIQDIEMQIEQAYNIDDDVECPDCEGVGGDCERCDGYGRVYRPDDIPPD